MGPAIVKEFKILWEGIEITEAIYKNITRTIQIPTINFCTITRDHIIEKDSSSWIIRIPKEQFLLKESDYNIEKASEILKIFKSKLSYSIVYTSIYRDEDSEYILKYPFSDA